MNLFVCELLCEGGRGGGRRETQTRVRAAFAHSRTKSGLSGRSSSGWEEEKEI